MISENNNKCSGSSKIMGLIKKIINLAGECATAAYPSAQLACAQQAAVPASS